VVIVEDLSHFQIQAVEVVNEENLVVEMAKKEADEENPVVEMAKKEADEENPVVEMAKVEANEENLVVETVKKVADVKSHAIEMVKKVAHVEDQEENVMTVIIQPRKNELFMMESQKAKRRKNEIKKMDWLLK
jgi:hypothetical protein